MYCSLMFPEVVGGAVGCLGVLGGYVLERGYRGCWGSHSAPPQVGATLGAAVQVMCSKAGLLLLMGFYFFLFYKNKVGFLS